MRSPRPTSVDALIHQQRMNDFKGKFKWGGWSNGKFVYCGETVTAFLQKKKIVIDVVDFIRNAEVRVPSSRGRLEEKLASREATARID